jgi:hypothetical protein
MTTPPPDDAVPARHEGAGSTGSPSGPVGGSVDRGTDGGAADGRAVDAATGSDAGDTGAPRSGLRNPAAAVRGLGAGTLALEAIVLLLAIQPIRIMGGELGGFGIGVVVALAVLCAVLAGSMKRPWAWHAGTAVQVLLLVSGLVHWSLAALGLIFGAAWAYATHVRRTILG